MGEVGPSTWGPLRCRDSLQMASLKGPGCCSNERSSMSVNASRSTAAQVLQGHGRRQRTALTPGIRRAWRSRTVPRERTSKPLAHLPTNTDAHAD